MIQKLVKHLFEIVILIILIYIAATITTHQKQGTFTGEITQTQYEPWFSPGQTSGRFGLLNKKTGEFTVFSDTLSKNMMLGEMKLNYGVPNAQ